MELFSNLGINGKLLLAQTINFLLVVFVLNKFVFRKLFKFLAERKRKIEKGIELTQKAEQEIVRINEARKREIEKAKQQGEVLLSEAKTLAQSKTREMLIGAKTQEEKILLKATAEAAKQKQDAVEDSKEEIKERALLFAEKILGRTLGKTDEEKIVKEVFDQFNSGFYAK